MITLFFIFLMLATFGKLLFFAIKAAWGITKILFTLLFVPIVLIGLFAAGLVYVAIAIAIVAGIIGFVADRL